MTFELRYVPCRKDAKAPQYASAQDSGADVFANFNNLGLVEFLDENPDLSYEDLEIDDTETIKSISLASGFSVKVPTGIKALLPQEVVSVPYLKLSNATETKFMTFQIGLQIRPKSGLAYKQGLTITNSPGTIDNGYIGELMVLVTNLTTTDCIDQVVISHGQKIAQIVPELVPILGNWKEASEDELSKVVSDRQEGCLGSTGI